MPAYQVTAFAVPERATSHPIRRNTMRTEQRTEHRDWLGASEYAK
jgi:hypothetical protein